MNFKLKPLAVALIATTTVLSGCSTEDEKIEKNVLTTPGQVNPVTGVIETAASGLVCQLPDIVQSIDSDFYPLTQDEKDSLRMVADPDGTWDADAIAVWNSNDLSVANTAYTYDYGAADLYQIFAAATTGHTNQFGLTEEEVARQVIAKAEAKAFKVGQKQDLIFGDNFDTWFDAWFAAVPYTDYLGASQRVARATRGLELSLNSANDNQEVCYTPPVECPNYKVLDESGTYDCVTPEENPIADTPAPIDTAVTGQAVVYFRKNGEQDSANYEGITIHTWNNSNCTAYAEDGDNASVTSWGQGKAPTGIDPNYGMYWVLDLVDGHDNCGNFIVYHKSTGDKFITQNDAMIPLGNSGDLVFHDVDKRVFFQEGFPANFIDGVFLANQHPFFGASASSKSCGWGTTLDESGEACLGQEIADCPTGSYAVGVGQTDIASKCIEEFDPTETTVYLRGGFNGWGDPLEGAQFTHKGNGQYAYHLAYTDHPADVSLSHVAGKQIEVMIEDGDTLTLPADATLDVNSIPADSVLMLADGTSVTLESDSNMLSLPDGVDAPTSDTQTFALAAGSKLTLAANANFGDFACVTECETSYFFKVADANWSEPTTYGGVKGGDTPSVGGTIALTAGEGVGQDMSISLESDSIYLFEFDAAESSAATLTIKKTPVAAFPMLTIDANDPIELTYTSDGQYAASKVALTAGTYSLVLADADNGFAVGGKTGDADVTIGEALTLENGGSALSLVVASDGEFDVVLDLSDVANPTLLVQPGVPYGTEKVYIRGTMTGWGDPAPDEDEAKYNEDTREYSVIYGLEAGGTHAFKFASKAWGGALDLGPGAYDLSTEDGALTINEGGNFEVSPTESTAYEFSISFDGRTKGELKVVEAPIYIRGGIYGSGDWGADETMRLNFEPSDAGNNAEASHVYSSIVTTTGTGFFKIADEGWGGSFGFNYGASAEQDAAGTNVIELGVPFNTTSGGDSKNISFQQPAGQYRFSFDDVTKQLTVTAID